MTISNRWWKRPIACGIALLLAAPAGLAATGQLPEAPRPNARSVAPLATSETASRLAPLASAPEQQPYSSSLLVAQAVSPAPPPASGQNGAAAQAPATAPASQQNAPQQPVGTAAAPYVRPEGVPASRPAGAAIAPAKQKRVRIYVIRIALLVGAAAAIGTVVAASEGSPARP